jgi:HAD superfamily hydrolase (TIGR01509 family)
MVSAILFDLFETLVTESRTRPAGVSSSAARLGCDRDAFRGHWKTLRNDVIAGRMSFRDAIGDITTRLGNPAEASILQNLCDERTRIKAEAFAHIEPGVLMMLDDLRARGLRLGVISNCCAEDVTAWTQCALASRFDCATFSHQIGLAKPDPEIYRAAARALHVDVSETWFIGDGQDDELRGAEQAGLRAWKAVWFLRRWPHFQQEEPSRLNLEAIEEVVELLERSSQSSAGR